MTDPHPLESLLERTAERVNVSPAPTERLAHEAARARRGRLASLASVTAVLVLVGGLAGATGLVPDARDPMAPPGPTTPPEGAHDAAPAGTRLVGLGLAAIAVPEEWGTNDTRCGVPQRDTVVIDVGLVEACAALRPAGVDSVEVTMGRPPFEFEADRSLEIGGMIAGRQDTECADDLDGVETCTGTLRLPDLGVSFRVESSTNAGVVDRLLDGIELLDGQIGIPGYMPTFNQAQEDSGKQYAALLRQHGFAVRTEVVDSNLPRGFIKGVQPQPGTVVDQGSEVVVKVAGPN